jgi:hypothetical protein
MAPRNTISRLTSRIDELAEAAYSEPRADQFNQLTEGHSQASRAEYAGTVLPERIQDDSDALKYLLRGLGHTPILTTGMRQAH